MGGEIYAGDRYFSESNDHDSDTAPTAYRIDGRIEEIMQTNRKKYDKSESCRETSTGNGSNGVARNENDGAELTDAGRTPH